MAVEVDDGDGAVCSVDGAEERQGDGVVTAEGDDSGESLSLLGRAGLVRCCLGRSGEDVVVALLNLLESPCVVVTIL